MKRILAVLTLLGAASPANASLVVLTNLAAGGSITGMLLSTTDWAAVGLTTDTTGVQFESMKVYLSNNAGSDLDVEGGIYSDSFGSPGTLLGAFVPQMVVNGTSSTIFTILTASPFSMSASTDYWFVLHDQPGGLLWNTDGVGNGTTPDATAGYSLLGYQQSVNAGSAWGASSLSPALEITVSEAAAVPEPGTVAMLAGGLLALAYVRRARRS
jgi:hypothetical protein